MVLVTAGIDSETKEFADPDVMDAITLGVASRLNTAAEPAELDIRTLFDDPNSPPQDADAVFAAAILEAGGRRINLAGLTLTGEFRPTDVSCKPFNGKVLARPGRRVFYGTVTPGPARTIVGGVAGIRTLNLGASATLSTTMPHRETIRTLEVSQPDLDVMEIGPGSALHLSSASTYEAVFEVDSVESNWRACIITVLGVAMGINLSVASLAEGVTLTTAAGGFARVQAVNINADATTETVVLFNSVGGLFAAGATVSVNGSPVGTVAWAPRIATTDPLNDTVYETTPVLWSANPDVEFDLDIEIGTTTDPFLPMDPDDRADAIIIRGAVGPKVRLHIDRGYRRGIDFESCLNPRWYVTGGNLWDDTDEEAYGYAVMESGHTQGGVGFLDVERVRHGFTTGALTQLNPPANGLEMLRTGTPKRGTVFGRTRHTTSAGIDLHGGAVEYYFPDISVYFPGSGGRKNSRSVGMSDRGVGTRVGRLYVHTATWGIASSSFTMKAERDWVNEFCNVTGENLRESLFRHGSDVNGADTSMGSIRYVLRNLVGSFQIGAQGSPYQQTGLDLSFAETEVHGLTIRNANTAAVSIRSQIAGLRVHGDVLFDWSHSGPGAASAFRFMAPVKDQQFAFVPEFTIRDNASNTAVESAVYVNAGVNGRFAFEKIRFDELTGVNAPTAGTRAVLNSGAGAFIRGTITALT